MNQKDMHDWMREVKQELMRRNPDMTGAIDKTKGE